MKVKLLANQAGRAGFSAEDFSAAYHLAWDEKKLYLRVRVKDKLPPLTSRRYPVIEADAYNGDEKSFCTAGIPSVWYYDNNPFNQLHTPCDSLDKIDFDKMTEGVKDAVELFKQLGGVK